MLLQITMQKRVVLVRIQKEKEKQKKSYHSFKYKYKDEKKFKILSFVPYNTLLIKVFACISYINITFRLFRKYPWVRKEIYWKPISFLLQKKKETHFFSWNNIVKKFWNFLFFFFFQNTWENP